MPINISSEQIREFQANAAAASEENMELVVSMYAEKLFVGAEINKEDFEERRSGLEQAKAFFRGLKLVSRELFIERIKNCIVCENVRIISPIEPGVPVYQCKLCNCFMNAKARLSGGKCPDGRF